MNKVAKGQRIEKKCADELKAQGYLTWKTIRHRFLNIDLFGLFDVAGLAADGSHLRLIQVKTNKVDKSVLDKIAAFKVPAYVRKEVWVWKDKKGWEKHNLSDEHACVFCGRVLVRGQAVRLETGDAKEAWACVGCDTWAKEYLRLAIVYRLLRDIVDAGEPQTMPITEPKKETIN